MFDGSLNAVVPQIYDAAVSSDRWKPALDSIVDAVGCRGLIVTSSAVAGMPYGVTMANSIYDGREADMADYWERFGHIDTEGLSISQATAPLTFMSDEDVWPGLFDGPARADVEWVRRVMDVNRRVAVNLSTSGNQQTGALLQFESARQDLPPNALARAAVLMPHLAKTLELHHFFSTLYDQYRAVLGVLDHMSVAIAAVDAAGRVVVRNGDFDRIAQARDGVQLRADGCLSFADDDCERAYRAYLARVAATAVGDGDLNGHLMPVPRRSGYDPFMLELAPLRDPADELGTRFSGCLVSLIDPQTPPPISVRPLKAYFGLTPSETAVAEGLLRGSTLAHLADERSVSVETIKSQCKSIYEKARVGSRVEFIRRIVALSPPVKPARAVPTPA